MTDTPMKFAATTKAAIPLHVVAAEALDDFLARQDDTARAWISASGFAGALKTGIAVPGPDGTPAMALIGHGDAAGRARGRFWLAGALHALPPGTYRIASGLAGAELEAEALGWLFGNYRFDRYARQSPARHLLIAPDGVDASRIETLAESEALTRDLVNTPAADMGPAELAAAAQALARDFGAACTVIEGQALLDQNFPMIHAVGRAATAARAPRLIDLRWGEAGPKLTLVGKGVCFDTGGLDLKPAASMGLMKKDMGGAANVLGLARSIMALKLPVQLRVLIPAVENAVSADAFRPQDILTSRAGLTVEINNTDAEGRLVLADALTYGAEEEPDLMLSMATLTGAARVAVGADLAPVFADDDAVFAAIDAAGRQGADPVWRMPFHDPYEALIEPGIADLDNAPKGGFGGAITAALFLRRFAGRQVRYTHFDVYSWSATAQPGRSQGGFGQGGRAVLGALPQILAL
ncbi:leucyl aminopeptidase family protein [Pseudooceanicola aestuarii]|uniref:leucyl aminopeptidase family protein n=1 Tax=Pseudooceanicola aestuarii TaxID=2697319 RepID=UPI0013D2000A|nr:leucyl aminopeptidase family protein [Pseudooceanicola aestuarii]